MKRRNTSISLVSTFLVIVIATILLASFVFLGYNQHKTNKELLNAISQMTSRYTTNESNIYPGTNSINRDETQDISNETEVMPDTNLDVIVSDEKSESVNEAEYSSAMAYLAKLQEVSSINNTSSLLALVYTILSSLILTYGAKMLRLGENDKEKLVQELTENSLERISNVETHMMVKSSIANAVVAINSTISLLQLFMQNLSNNKQDLRETINSSLMDSFLDMCDQLNGTYRTIRKFGYKNADISGLECAMKSLEQSFEIYKSCDLPQCIDDKACAEKKINATKETYKKIAKLKTK